MRLLPRYKNGAVVGSGLIISKGKGHPENQIVCVINLKSIHWLNELIKFMKK